MVKILVTGAAGFIGSALARHLVWQGENLILLVRDKAKLPKSSIVPSIPAMTVWK